MSPTSYQAAPPRDLPDPPATAAGPVITVSVEVRPTYTLSGQTSGKKNRLDTPPYRFGKSRRIMQYEIRITSSLALETTGIEPATSCLQSRRSPS